MQPQAATLRFALFPRTSLVADAVLVLAGALLVAASAQISFPLPFTPVPITGQTMAVLLVGASLGAGRGAASLGLYLLLGIVGTPVYAGGADGVGVIFGASGGYLLSYPIAAAITGALAERRWDRRVPSAAVAMLAGSAAIYVVGLPWLAAVTGSGVGRTLELGLVPFIPGDLFKLALAAGLLPAAWGLVKRVRGEDPDSSR